MALLFHFHIWSFVLLGFLTTGTADKGVSINVEIFDPAGIPSQLAYHGGTIRITCTFPEGIKGNISLQKIQTASGRYDVLKVGSPNETQFSYTASIDSDLRVDGFTCFNNQKTQAWVTGIYDILCNPTVTPPKVCPKSKIRDEPSFCNRREYHNECANQYVTDCRYKPTNRFMYVCHSHHSANYTLCDLFAKGWTDRIDFAVYHSSSCQNDLKFRLCTHKANETLKMFGWTYADVPSMYGINMWTKISTGITVFKCNAASNQTLISKDKHKFHAAIISWSINNLLAAIRKLSHPAMVYIACSSQGVGSKGAGIVFSTQLFVFNTTRDLHHNLTETIWHSATDRRISATLSLTAKVSKGLYVCVSGSNEKCLATQPKDEAAMKQRVACKPHQDNCTFAFYIAMSTSSPSNKYAPIYNTTIYWKWNRSRTSLWPSTTPVLLTTSSLTTTNKTSEGVPLIVLIMSSISAACAFAGLSCIAVVFYLCRRRTEKEDE